MEKFSNIELKVRAFMNIFLNFQDGFFTVIYTVPNSIRGQTVIKF
jgi:hypothetical protein